ncbi:MAG: DinB family protein [Chloroflexi bacterium]|nr:DinB family protein [Chloroflexota bacterium]
MERADAVAQLAATGAQAAELVRGLTPAQLQQRPSEGEWSLKEIVAHLRDAVDVWGGRLHRAAEEETPFLPGWDEAQQARVRSYYHEHFGMALDALAFHRERTLTLLAGLDEAGWRRAVQHEEAGRLTIAEMVERMTAHERDHIEQMRRAKAALGETTP